MWRWLAAAAAAVVLVGIWASGLAALRSGTGYFAPVFTPDGRSILAIRRRTSAVTLGFGYEFFTPPATVFIQDDRYALVSIAIPDHRLTVLGDLPSSPLTGRRLQAYHGAIFGSSTAHLRWEDGRLSYAVAVTRYDTPQSRTFVARGQWDRAAARFVEPPAWRESTDSAGGDEPEQLFRNLEVMALPGSEGLPCGVVTLDETAGRVTPLVMTSTCVSKFSREPAMSDVSPLSRRHDIERAVEIKQTYAALVARGVAAGANEGTAMLQANKEMERLGYFPRSPTLTATRTRCESADTAFTISDEEFRVGMFQDIDRAIAHPGDEVDKDTGDYVLHQAFDTSRQLNEYLADRNHTAFRVSAHGVCWQMRIDRHESTGARATP